MGQVVAPDLVKGLGNGYYCLIKAFVQDKGSVRRHSPFRLEQFVWFDIQGRGKLNQRLRGNPTVAVFDVAEEINGNIQFLR